jgi:flagellar motor component MotA
VIVAQITGVVGQLLALGTLLIVREQTAFAWLKVVRIDELLIIAGAIFGAGLLQSSWQSLQAARQAAKVRRPW